MTGRGLGPGKLYQRRRPDGTQAWVLDFKDGGGRRVRKQLGTDRRVAERQRIELIHQRDLELAGLGRVEGQSKALAELVPAYLAELGQRAGAKQVRNVRDRLARILSAVCVVRVRDLKPVDVLRFRDERRKSGVANRTANADVDALKAMLNWAVRVELIAENPLHNIPRLPIGEEHQKHPRRALTEPEIERFLAAAEADDADCAATYGAERTIEAGTKGADYAEQRRPPRVPQAPLWRALIESGARWGELTQATWADLDEAQGTLTLRATTTKSGRSRVIPVRRDVVRELVGLKGVHMRVRRRLVQPGDRVFLSPDGLDQREDTANIRRILARLLERAGIPRVDELGRRINVHAMRHTSATQMARRGVAVGQAQVLLGHRDPRLTMAVYTHLDTDDLRGAIEAAHGPRPTPPRLVRDAHMEESA
jgi:integrase